MAVSVYVRQVFVDVLTKGVAAIHTLADVSIFCIFAYLHICIFVYICICTCTFQGVANVVNALVVSVFCRKTVDKEMDLEEVSDCI